MKSFLVEQGRERHVMREKELLNTLKHENIIKLIATFQDDKNLFFVFEHAENGMLEDLIKMCKRRLGEDLIKIYMAQLVNFLEYMQKNDVMHRDLKPQNIMLDAEYNIKVIDFGDAKKQ